MKIKHLLTIFLLALFSTAALSQAQLYIGNDYFKDLRFQKAITAYIKAIKKRPTLEATQKLADCYRFTKNYPRAEFWYEKAVTFPGSPSSNLYYYAQMLKTNEKYDRAREIFLKYAQQKDVNAYKAAQLIASCDSAIAWQKLPINALLSNRSDLNSSYSDFGSVKLSDVAYVYSSNRPLNSSANTKLAKDMELPYFNIVFARMDEQNQAKEVNTFKLGKNYNYHRATPSFTANFDTIYFTQSVLAKTRKESINRLQVFYSVRKDSTWSEPQAFAYNNPNYSVGHPFVSPDGSNLYFVSDAPGGKGGYDIYVSEWVNGGWGSPQNLGDDINSDDDEFYPVLKDDKLYFSSMGHIGLGGLDLFVSEINPQGGFGLPRNMKAPFNSAQDDFALSFDEAKKTGFLSSNRIGGLGMDDIYSFDITKAKTPEYYLEVVPFYTDNTERVRLDGCQISVSNKMDNQAVNTAYYFEKSYFLVNDGQNYTVRTRKDGFLNTVEVAAIKDFKILDTVVLRQGLQPDLAILLEYPVQLQELAMNRSYVLNNIYYDLNKSYIRPDAAIELDKLVTILKENPEISVQLGSYCDSRGDDYYNQDLSQRRAQAVVDYLVRNGIGRKRLKAKGYGETKLLNECENGVECSEEKHQENRRTDFQIIAIEKK